MKAYSTVFWKTCAWEPCGRWFPVGHARKMRETCSEEHARLLTGKLTRERSSVNVCGICGDEFASNAIHRPNCYGCIPDEAAKARYGKYGLSEPKWQAMLARFNGKCWLCKEKPANCVDHCHRSGVVRGALCTGCNAQLGQLERTQFVDKAQKYLRLTQRHPVHLDQCVFVWPDEQATARGRAREGVRTRRTLGRVIRQWGREQGWDLSNHGPLPGELLEAWHEEHPGEVYAPLMSGRKRRKGAGAA